MSRQLIDRSPDLKKLQDDGYDIEIRAAHLLVKDVPYVNSNREVKRGILVSTLNLAGDVTALPNTHVAMFVGEYPCDKNGAPLDKISHGGGQQLAPNLSVNYSFSSKPIVGAYNDYYEKITAYVAMLLSHAQAIDATATAQTFPVITATAEESVFKYLDTASSRAGINMASRKLELPKIAIVGLGGSGSYVLDLVAKTPVKEIHLFDGDILLSHNAFRTPGAVSIDDLTTKQKKVAYLKKIYSNLHWGIIEHPYNIDGSNIDELQGMAYVFVCVDPGKGKQEIVEGLERLNITFIDVGMGIDLVDDSLHGVLRVTTNSPERRDHFRKRVSLAGTGLGDEYDRNIQIADLNALNASLAVLKWKKLCGFYLDYEKEHHSTYTIDCNMLTSDEK